MVNYKERSKKPRSFKVAFLFHRTSLSNFFLKYWAKSRMLNAQKHFQQSYSFMVNMLTWQFYNSNCSLFSIWVFFHKHLRFTGQQVKGQVICLAPLYHFYPLYRHWSISRETTAETSPLHIANSRTRNGNLWLPSTSH